MTIEELLAALAQLAARTDATPEELATELENLLAAAQELLAAATGDQEVITEEQMSAMEADVKNVRDLIAKKNDAIKRKNNLLAPVQQGLTNRVPTNFATAKTKKSKHYASDENAVKMAQLLRGAKANSPTNSGILIPEELTDGIIKLRDENGYARRVAAVEACTTDLPKKRKQVSGPTVSWIGAGDTATAGDMRYVFLETPIRHAMIKNEYYEVLGEDADISMADEFAEYAGYAFANAEDNVFINGDNTSTYGNILGVLKTFEKLVTDVGGTWATDSNKLYAGSVLPQSGSSGWSNIVDDDITKLIAKVATRQGGLNKAFHCSSQFYWEVMVPLQTATGGVTMTEMVDGILTPKYLGYPVIISDFYPNTSAANTIPLVFGDMKAGAWFADRRQITVETDKNIETQLWKQVATERFGVNVHDAGTADATTAANRLRGAIAALAMKA